MKFLPKILLAFLVMSLFIVPALAETSEECSSRQEECASQCNEICNTNKYEYCRKYEYSGCALDVFCWCNVCGLYDQKWCLNDGWIALVSGPKETYAGCIGNCNSRLEAGQDVSTCWNDCNSQMSDSITQIKHQVCEDYCKENHYQYGAWATFSEGVWDTCYCEGDAVEDSITEDMFPSDEDSDADGVLNINDWCPEEEGSKNAYGCPDQDGDGVPDFADKCNDEKGTWDYAGCAMTNADYFAEAPYKFAEWVRYMLTPQGKKPSGRQKVGFVSAVMNKGGIRIFRNGEWMRVGVHTNLYDGDLLRTGPDSKVKLRIFESEGSSTVLDVRPNSIFEAQGESDYYGGERPAVFLIKGAVKTVYRRLTSSKPNFYVKTPCVVLGIRGTEFIVSHEPETKTDLVQVIEGEVAVNGTTSTVLSPGQQIESLDGDLQEVQAFSLASFESDESQADRYDAYFPWRQVLLACIILGVGALFFAQKQKK